MVVTRAARRIVQFMLFTLVINMGGWTFNKDAVADVWFDEQRSLIVEAEHTSTGHEAPQTVSHQHICNHWCHAVGHFMGLLGQSVSATPEFSNEYSVQQFLAIQPSSPDGLFRPPRRIS
ncbi:MAG: hypothetical protein ACOY9D_11160, partial [Pseudomonadota bacterium]